MNERNAARSLRLGDQIPPTVCHFQRSLASERFHRTVSLALLCLVLPIFAHASSRCLAQGSKTITADTGVQFEGKYFSVKDISETTAAMSMVHNGFEPIVIDNGLRLVFLNPSHVQAVGNSTQDKETSFNVDQHDANWSEGGGTFVSVSPFDQYGHRDFTIGIQTKGGTPVRKTYVQGIVEITPRYCVLKNLIGSDTVTGRKQWKMYISTGTVPKSVIRNVLLSRIKDPNKPDEFFEIALLFQQMGDFSQADEELRLIEANPNFAGLKERIRDARDQLGQLKARQILREISLRKDSGQNDLAVELAKATYDANKARLAGEIKSEFEAVAEEEIAARNQLQQTRGQVFELIDNIQNVNGDQAEAISRFRKELETDLNQFNILRLDAYRTVAKAVGVTDQDKFSRAMSGWVLGSNHASPNLAEMQGLFRVRDLVVEYLQELTAPERRTAILKELEFFETGTPEHVDWMIQQMKPVAAPPELAEYTGEEPIQFSVQVPGTAADPEPKTYRCLAHLPPQYNPYRKYPLILSLPGGLQTIEQNLDLWCGSYNEKLKIRQGQAMRNGYVVVSVDWRNSGQLGWGYSAREHRIVMDALWHAMRKFSIDSDRVFLSGHRDGGDGAYDIGVAHPEHWAGVIGFSGKFRKYIDKYWNNEHGPIGPNTARKSLALYCVNGQKDFPAIGSMKYAINKWMKPPYLNPTWVWYKGRGNELFMEDLPEAFKWMRGQKRSWPGRDNGFSFVCSALRPWDSYFWFFEMDGIPDQFVVLPELFEMTDKFNKLTLSGSVANNTFRLGPANLRVISNDSTLWLSPQFVDFSEPIVIEGRGKFKDYVKRSLKVVLDDYLRRADREHIYHARINCISGNWEVGE